jgi:hypothetical protein
MRTLSITPHSKQTSAVRTGAWGKVRRAAGEIAPESIERIAQRVVQLLRHEAPGELPDSVTAGLVDAARLARHLGMTRAWVYEHAHELGGIRVGNGPRARLRFDVATVTAALAAHGPANHRPAPEPTSTRRPRQHPRTSQPSAPLLPVHDTGMRGLLARRVFAVNCLSYRPPRIAADRRRQDRR